MLGWKEGGIVACVCLELYEDRQGLHLNERDEVTDPITDTKGLLNWTQKLIVGNSFAAARPQLPVY
jgi:hypothetical protein